MSRPQIDAFPDSPRRKPDLTQPVHMHDIGPATKLAIFHAKRAQERGAYPKRNIEPEDKRIYEAVLRIRKRNEPDGPPVSVFRTPDGRHSVNGKIVTTQKLLEMAGVR